MQYLFVNVGKHKGYRLLGRAMSKWADNINRDLKE
jgi:hypothetical protein